MQKSRIAFALFLAACIMLSCSITALAAETVKPFVSLEKTIADTGAYLLKTVPDPRVGSIGGEWTVIGLARAGYEVPPSWYTSYYKNLEAEIREKHGVLHDQKYTEYSRVVLALTAIGEDPTNVGGYNLLAKLGDFNQVLWQGINGPIFALLALDAGNYAIPARADAQVQTTRELLVEAIIKQQLSDGGFSLDGKAGDPDLTAMALQALAPYQDCAETKAAIDKALACLSSLQNSDGGYAGWGVANSESVDQVLVALTALGIDPETDSRFIKDGNTIIDNLMTFFVKGGGFKHVADDAEPNGMATEQGLYALAAYKRYLNEQNSLYDMSDATDLVADQNAGTTGLPGKSPNIEISSIIEPDKTFEDIVGNGSREAIELLAFRGIINIISDTAFEPDRTMTVNTEVKRTCTLSVTCKTILDNMDSFNKDKLELLPADGVIYPLRTVTFYEGESVFNVLQREMKKHKIHLEFEMTPLYNSNYIEGINNIYEFDCGKLSGWMYKVNGWFPNYGCSRYLLKDGDVIEWLYTCDLGRDVGGGFVADGGGE